MDTVSPDEVLARYIFDKRHYSILDEKGKEGRVNYRAFLPTKNGETSAFRVAGLSDAEIWEIGEREVAQKRNQPLLARGDIDVAKVIALDLKVNPDNSPPGHANIIGWPEKSAQKAIAIELAGGARLHLNKFSNT